MAGTGVAAADDNDDVAPAAVVTAAALLPAVVVVDVDVRLVLMMVGRLRMFSATRG